MVNLVFKWCEQGFRPLEKGLSDVKEERVTQGPCPGYLGWLTSWRPRDLKWIDRTKDRKKRRAATAAGESKVPRVSRYLDPNQRLLLSHATSKILTF